MIRLMYLGASTLVAGAGWPASTLLTTGVGIQSVYIGATLLGVAMFALAAFFTVRSKVAEVWRQEAEGWREKSDGLEATLTREREEQRDVRHALKQEVGTMKALLAVERAKTDLSGVMELLAAESERAATRAERIVEALEAVATKLNGEKH